MSEKDKTGEVETQPAERMPARREGGTSATSVAVVGNAGLAALGQIPEQQFEQQVVALTLSLKRIEHLKTVLLEPGVDYDVIPGTKKPTLLQPGAQKLNFVARLAPSYNIQRHGGDGGPLSPAVLYVVTCRLHLGTTSAEIVCEGVGSCSSHEKKYRYRMGERKCPECGKVGFVRKGKADRGGGWYCWKKPERGMEGCGAKFADGDERIEKQDAGLVENPDVLDLDNTILKMAKKRALVDATLQATCSSGMFTQDMEDLVNPAAREQERGKLLAQLGGVFKQAGVTKNKDMWDACSRLMNKPTDPQKLSLSDLRVLVERASNDPALRGTRPRGDAGSTATPVDDGDGEGGGEFDAGAERPEEGDDGLGF